MLNDLQKDLMEKVMDLHEIPHGAVSVRVNGENKMLSGSKNISVVKKIEIPGFTANIMANTKNKSLHVPVLIDQEGITDEVMNDFNVGQGSDILIVAGCGIHNTGKEKSSHTAKHKFMIGDNCRVRYVERHVALGNDDSPKQLSPKTEIYLGKNSVFEMETTQTAGVSISERITNASLQEGAKLFVREKILTNNDEHADSTFVVLLNGKNSKLDISSRSVAKGNSCQCFLSTVIGREECFGRVECDGIVMDKAVISSAPTIIAKHADASLTHEAQIGKIAGEQLTKLMTLGLTKEEAEAKIIEGFLK